MIPPRVARLLASGSTDTTFDPGTGPSDAAYAVACLADGKYLVGGEFSTVNGVERANLVLFNEDGSVDTEFNNQPNNAVRSLFPQTDGKTIVCGQFTALGLTTRNRIFRVQANNTVEPAFDPNVDDTIWCSFIQENGLILIGGDFGLVGSVSRQAIARLLNNASSTDLQVQSATTVFWGRSGTSSEAQVVKFELSTDGGTIWSTLGFGSRTTGGWRLAGLSLSGSGLLRATAYPSSSQSQTVMQDTISFDFAPAIQVEQPQGTPLSSGVSVVAYGSSQTGVTTDITFTIRNVGLENLTLDGDPTPAVALSGTNADQWTVVEQPALAISPQGTVTFVVRFQPTSTGAKAATLTVNSDDPTTPAFTVSLTGTGTPGPGSRDNTFQPVFNSTVLSTSIDPLNRIYFGGSFTTLNSVASNRIARVLSTGAPDTTLTGTKANNSVNCSAQQSDGKFLVGGSFTSYNGVTRNRLARVLENGSLDTSFNVSLNGPCNSIDIQTDGKIIVAGDFTTAAGVSRAGGVVRLNTSGSVDAGFVPWFTNRSALRRAVILGDGGIIVLGDSYIYKITASGARDSAFNTNGEVAIVGGSPFAVAEQADGKLLVGGVFSTINSVSRTNLARLNADGSVDTSFTCNTNNAVYALNVQADGKILAVGVFTTIGGESVARVARLNSDGTVDDTFVTNVSAGSVFGIATQEDGQVIVNGDFTIESTSAKVARLVNGSASDSLTVVDATEVQWLRSGTSPEVASVEFQFSQDSGVTWSSAGVGERIEGGWELSGIQLPVSGILRALASAMGGYGNSSCTLLESRVSFSGLLSPDIQVEQPTNTVVADDGSVTFAGKLVGQIGLLDFTIRNTGNATLSGISVVSSNAAEFQVTALGATSVVAGGVTTFQVRFTPVAIGARTATLTVGSNVPGFKNPYTISLSGNGITTPTALTNPAQTITSSGAVLTGSVTARDDTASVIFQWRVGTAGAWTTVAASPASVSGFSATPVSYSLGGLSSGTTYNFRVGITNSVTGPSSPVYGPIRSFSTL